MKNISGTKIFCMTLTAIIFSLILIPAGSAANEVKEGDWIKYDFTISGAPSGTSLPDWIKVEFLSVTGTKVTMRVTTHMSDGTEDTDTMTLDVATGSGGESLSGVVIPANQKKGDSVEITSYGTVTIDGESTRIYAGASRTVVYASVSQYGTELTYYWDKQTGVMVEVSGTSAGMTLSAKATGTNMWEAGLFSGQELWILVIIIVAVVAAGSAVLLLRRRKAPIPEVTPAPTE